MSLSSKTVVSHPLAGLGAASCLLGFWSESEAAAIVGVVLIVVGGVVAVRDRLAASRRRNKALDAESELRSELNLARIRAEAAIGSAPVPPPPAGKLEEGTDSTNRGVGERH